MVLYFSKVVLLEEFYRSCLSGYCKLSWNASFGWSSSRDTIKFHMQNVIVISYSQSKKERGFDLFWGETISLSWTR